MWRSDCIQLAAVVQRSRIQGLRVHPDECGFATAACTAGTWEIVHPECPDAGAGLGGAPAHGGAGGEGGEGGDASHVRGGGVEET